MIRFVDLTSFYWTDPEDRKPCCAFLSTGTDRFLENDVGAHKMSGPEDVEGLGELAERCAGLVPEGFWDYTDPPAGG